MTLPLVNLEPGDRMRYSTTKPHTLVPAVDSIMRKPRCDVSKEMVSPRIGANGPLFSTLDPGGVALVGAVRQCRKYIGKGCSA